MLTHELAIFKALNVRGLGMWRERLVVMNECETSLALFDLLIPMRFWLKRPSENSSLPFGISISFQSITRVGRPDQNQV